MATSPLTFTSILHLCQASWFTKCCPVCDLLGLQRSCMLGRAGVSVISIMQVRTARLGGRFHGPQCRGEAGSEPLSRPHTLNGCAIHAWLGRAPDGNGRRFSPSSKELSFPVEKRPVSQRRRERNAKVGHGMNHFALRWKKHLR